MSNKAFIKLGAVMLTIGGFISFLGTVLHDQTLPTASGEDRLYHIANDNLWVPLHFTIVLGTMASLIGFIALYRYLTRRGESPLAQLATVFAIVSSTFSLLLLSLDGFAMKHIVVDWMNATDGRETLFAVAHGFEHLNLMMFSLFVVLYFGVTLGLYGATLLHSQDFPKWLGLLALTIGISAFLAGSYQLLFDLTNVSTAVFVVCWIFTSIWEMTMGNLLFRKATKLSSSDT